jgi:hypothetical protein
MNIGDLVKLKGFNLTDQNEIPYGIISVDLGLDKYKVRWLNDKIAARWTLSPIMPASKLELVNAVIKVLDS